MSFYIFGGSILILTGPAVKCRHGQNSQKSFIGNYFLLFISIGVFPAALGYGLNPKEFLPVLYGIEVADNNLSNIFRAIMGLYIGCVLLWVFGAFNKSLAVPALWCMFVFMLGIGLGRALSLILDGMPDTIFVFFMILNLLLQELLLFTCNF